MALSDESKALEGDALVCHQLANRIEALCAGLPHDVAFAALHLAIATRVVQIAESYSQACQHVPLSSAPGILAFIRYRWTQRLNREKQQ